MSFSFSINNLLQLLPDYFYPIFMWKSSKIQGIFGPVLLEKRYEISPHVFKQKQDQIKARFQIKTGYQLSDNNCKFLDEAIIKLKVNSK